MIVSKNRTIMLLHFEDNTFKDECGHVLSTNAAVTINNNIRLFNNNAYFNGSALLEYNASSDFYFGTNDYTIEFWFNLSSIKSDQYFTDMLLAGGNYLAMEYYNNSFIYCVNGKSIINIPYSINTNTWYHLAISRYNNTILYFLNGKKIGSVVNTANHGSTSYKLVIGDFGGSGSYKINGYMDEFMISNYARYINDFTVPVTQFLFKEFLIQDGTNLNNTDGVGLFIRDSIPYNIKSFDSYTLNDLSLINNNVISKISNQKFNVGMLK